MPAVLLRCDGGPEIGLGHLMRCRALAAAFRELGWRCVFAISAPSASLLGDETTVIVPVGADGASAVGAAIAAQNIDCLVVDHYGLDAQFENAVAKNGTLMVVVDDLANRPHRCNLLVDAGPQRKPEDYARLTADGTRLLLGARYALLRPEFRILRASQHASRRKPEKLIITLGGADPRNVSIQALEALPHLGGTGLRATLIVGPANPNRAALTARALALGAEVICDPPNLVALMADSDIAITGGGTTCLEFACFGIPAVAIIIADNQRDIAQAIGNAGAACVLEGEINPQRVAHAVGAIAADPALRDRMRAAGRALIDGHGAGRVAKETARLLDARTLGTCN